MEIFQRILMSAALGGLIALGVAFFLEKFCAPLWDQVLKFTKLPRIQQFVLFVFTVGLIQYGVTKHDIPIINFYGGIKQNPIQPSIVTNNLVSIHWTRDTAQGLVPETATVYIDVRLRSNTNGVWETLAETTVGAWSWSGTFQDATNYNYNVWAYYIPPEPVHTNGVWIYNTLKDRNERFPIPLRARIEVNGKAISTPKEKRKDMEND